MRRLLAVVWLVVLAGCGMPAVRSGVPSPVGDRVVSAPDAPSPAPADPAAEPPTPRLLTQVGGCWPGSTEVECPGPEWQP